MKRGRPIRFLGGTLAGWTALRIIMLWPSIDGVPALVRAVAPPLAAATLPPRVVIQVPPPIKNAHRAERTLASGSVAAPPPGSPLAHGPAPLNHDVALALTAPVAAGETVPAGRNQDRAELGTIPPPLRPTPPPSGTTRLSGSAWLLARGGSGGTLSGGRLGGSQAGIRLTYGLDKERRIALAARAATPLQGAGREAAIGLEWRPTALPVRLVAEQRFSLDGGRGGPTLMALGGIGPRPIVAGATLEAYAQAGAVARNVVEGFADGAARLVRPVATLGRTQVDIGAGSWGAVQRGTGRVDVGPTMGMRVPVGTRAFRLTLDWRERVAGKASPGSGPAFSLGTDF
jgi:hypothetical protein